MWPLGSIYTRPRPCIRKACSTRSTYSAGLSRPILSVRPRISVLRLRQLSVIGRFYDLDDDFEQRRQVDLAVRREEQLEPTAGMAELAHHSTGSTASTCRRSSTETVVESPGAPGDRSRAKRLADLARHLDARRLD